MKNGVRARIGDAIRPFVDAARWLMLAFFGSGWVCVCGRFGGSVIDCVAAVFRQSPVLDVGRGREWRRGILMLKISVQVASIVGRFPLFHLPLFGRRDRVFLW